MKNNNLKLQIFVSPVVDPVMDIVKVVDAEPEEKHRRQDGDDNHQNAEILNYGQTLNWPRRWPHQHLKEENICLLIKKNTASRLLIVIQLFL